MILILFLFSLVLMTIGIFRSSAFKNHNDEDHLDYISNIVWVELIGVSALWLSAVLLRC
jgi:hypothetical protein